MRNKFKDLLIILILILISGGLMIFMLPSDIRNNELTEAGEVGTIYFQITYLIIYIVAFFLFIQLSKSQKKIIISDMYLLLLLLLCVVSTLWSINFSLSLRRVMAIIGPSILGYYIASRYSFVDSIKLINISFLISAILSIATIYLMPNYGLMNEVSNGNLYVGAWKGIFGHKNIFGRNMALLILTSFILHDYDKKNIHLIKIILGVWLIIMSQSKTSLIIVIISIIIVILWKWIRNPKKYIFSLMTMGTTIFIFCLYVLANLELAVSLLGRDLTFTGRVYIWSRALNAITQKPIWGYGYGSFWLKSNKQAFDIWSSFGVIPNAHNGLMDITLQIGLVGLFLFQLFFISNYFRYFKYSLLQNSPIYNWGIAFFTSILIYNIFETNIMQHNDIYWLLIVFTVSAYKVINLKKIRLVTKTQNLGQVL